MVESPSLSESLGEFRDYISLTSRSGNVGTGAKDMLEALGVEWVQPEQLSSVTDSSKVRSIHLGERD